LQGTASPAHLLLLLLQKTTTLYTFRDVWSAEVKQILWWLIAGSKGGINRARIILALNKRPYNANQLTQMFSLDYKTVRHHLDVLRKHHVITATGEEYGTMYFLSESMKTNFEDFLEIWKQVDVPDEVRGE
jgi:DNA-binding transcriptional ArsR family regulator